MFPALMTYLIFVISSGMIIEFQYRLQSVLEFMDKPVVVSFPFVTNIKSFQVPPVTSYPCILMCEAYAFCVLTEAVNRYFSPCSTFISSLIMPDHLFSAANDVEICN